ncbi:unnamed protein product [Caretta caretta]
MIESVWRKVCFERYQAMEDGTNGLGSEQSGQNVYPVDADFVKLKFSICESEEAGRILNCVQGLTLGPGPLTAPVEPYDFRSRASQSLQTKPPGMSQQKQNISEKNVLKNFLDKFAAILRVPSLVFQTLGWLLIALIDFRRKCELMD